MLKAINRWTLLGAVVLAVCFGIHQRIAQLANPHFRQVVLPAVARVETGGVR